MKIAVVGMGYVGLVSAVCLAESGNDVIGVDIDQRRLRMLRRGEVPFYEPGLGELLVRNLSAGRLRFTGSLARAVRRTEVVFIAVATPQGADGAADVSAVESVGEDIARAMNGYRVVVVKSTVPVGFGDRLQERMGGLTSHPFDLVSNPEFLKEGAALDDFLRPDRVVVGTDSDRAFALMEELYAPFLRTGRPLIRTDRRSAELGKYAANIALATRISLMNELARLAEATGADIEQVRRVVAADRRIGSSYLFAGVGFGGSCFPKDVRAAEAAARSHGLRLHLIAAVDQVNRTQVDFFLEGVFRHFDGDLCGRRLALWGLSFKPRTDDIREAPAVSVIDRLLEAQARLTVYDPAALANVRRRFGPALRYARDAYTCLRGAQALLIVTEWNQFRHPDFEEIKARLARPVIFDGRNLYSLELMRAHGFTYYSVGRPPVLG